MPFLKLVFQYNVEFLISSATHACPLNSVVRLTLYAIFTPVAIMQYANYGRMFLHSSAISSLREHFDDMEEQQMWLTTALVPLFEHLR